MKELIYLYGFVPAGTPPPPDVEGIAGREVEILDLGAFGAAVSRVPEEAFSPEALGTRLEDLAWVSDQGLRHEGVVNRFVDEGTILPARLLTLYSSPGRLAEDADGHRERIRGELDRLAGCREWDVKVSYDAPRMGGHLPEVSGEIALLDARIADSPPGTRYLLERKRGRILHEETRKAAGQLAAEFFQRLGERAIESRLLEAPIESTELPVVLYGALLVRRAEEKVLREEAARETARLEALGLLVSFTGPWAPYRFLERLDDAGHDRGDGT